MKRKEKLQELKEFLLKNFLDENGDLDISGLDFDDFDGNVNISFMRVRGNLLQEYQKTTKDIHQGNQIAWGKIFQDELE